MEGTGQTRGVFSGTRILLDCVRWKRMRERGITTPSLLTWEVVMPLIKCRHGRGGTGLNIAGVEQKKENRSWVHFWSCCVQMPEEPSGRGQIQLLLGLKLLQLRALFKRTNRNSKDQLRYRSLGGASARKGPEVGASVISSEPPLASGQMPRLLGVLFPLWCPLLCPPASQKNPRFLSELQAGHHLV